jgi:hypothetical protein
MGQLMQAIQDPTFRVGRTENNGIGGAGLPPTLSGLDHIEKQIAVALEAMADLESKLGVVLLPPSPCSAAEARSDSKPSGCVLRERLENLSRGMFALRGAIARISERIDL